MPFTPFHFGPALLLGLLLLDYLDFPTFVAANVAVDWRAFLVFYGFWPGPLHSWQSSYLGAAMLSIVLGLVMVKLRPYLTSILSELEIRQEVSKEKIFLAAFAGTFLHVTIDAFHHPDMPTFLPLEIRPLYGLFTTLELRTILFTCLLLSILVYFFKIWENPVKDTIS